MDIRILTLLLFISVTGSFADLRSPLFRSLRNGLQDDRPRVMDFTGLLRMKRESSSSAKSTTVPTSTLNPAVTLSKINSQSSSTKEPNPTTPSSESPKSDFTTPDLDSTTPDSDPSTPDSDPTTSDSTNSTPDTSSNTSKTSKPRTTITPAKPTTQKNRRSTPDQKSTTASLTATTASPTIEPSTPDSETTTSSPTTESSTPDSGTTTSSPTTTSNSKAPTTTPTPDSKASTTKPTTIPSPKDPDTKPTSSNPTDKSTTLKPKPETTKKPIDSEKSTTATPLLRSRFNDDESKEPNKISESNQTPNQGPNTGNFMYPGFPSFQFPPFFMPSVIPDFSSMYSPSNPYFAPNTGNNAWSLPNGGAGAATSFASASAGASAGTDYAQPLGYQGGYPDNLNTVNAPMAVEPIMGNAPNMFNAGGYGYGGGVPFDGGFAFPDIQRQVEENIRQLQTSIQKQQQWLSDRIADGSNIPGTHSAVSSIQLGPEGGYQSGAINPVSPGVESRFANELPPPSSGSYGVFSSSSSHTMVGPDGKTVSRKSSTTGVNDNGKITFRTVED